MLFTFQLLLRCCVHLADDYFIPVAWFEFDDVKIEYNHHMRLKQGIIYNTWEDVLANILPTKAPTIFIYRPDNALFRTFDAIVLFWKDHKVVDFYGYQLKRGSTMPKAEQVAPNAKITAAYPGLRSVVSFWVRGQASTDQAKCEWKIPQDSTMTRFFGESGRYWTPVYWNTLVNASHP